MENKDENIKETISKYWRYVQKEYKLMKILGTGTFGQVIHCKHRKTKEEVAIKFIKGELNSTQKVRNLIREISVLRQLSAMENNYFTTKLHDVIVAKKKH